MKKIITLVVAVLFMGSAASAQNIKKSVKVGTSVYELVHNEKNNSVYVATTRGNSGKATIYQFDAASLALKDSIDVSESAAFGLGINNTTQTLYTTNTRGASVYAIDLKTNKIVATIKNGNEKAHGREVLVDEESNIIYVSDIASGVWVIDGKTNKHIRQIENAGLAITGMALDKKKERLYLINNKSDKVFSYDLKKDVVIDSFSTGSKRAINLTLDAKTNRLFVANQGSGDVAVLDAETGKVLKTIPTGEGALGIKFDPAKNRVYVANRAAGTVTVIDAKSYEILANLESGSMPNTVVVDKKGNVYVSNKAKGGGRPKPGETPKPVDDPTGDTLTLIQ